MDVRDALYSVQSGLIAASDHFHYKKEYGICPKEIELQQIYINHGIIPSGPEKLICSSMMIEFIFLNNKAAFCRF